MFLVLFPALTLSFSNAFSQQVATHTQQATVTSTAQLSPEQRVRIERSRQLTTEISDLAGRIQSEADANALVDKIVELFADVLPPDWVTRGIRQRIAHAEYETVSDPARLIPEQRIADVWNEYVREIGAGEEALVSPAELHNLRDAQFASGQFLRHQEMNPSVWTISSIYAVDSDGKLAEGCRALEALRILYDLDRVFDTLRGARERVRKGILASDLIRERMENPPPQKKTAVRLEDRIRENPVGLAESRYVQQHGPYVLNAVMEKLFDELFPRGE
jgi:hypothetical protein